MCCRVIKKTPLYHQYIYLIYIYILMKKLVKLLPAQCLSMDPIQALDQMSLDNEKIYSPMLYGYVNYSRKGFRKNRIQFDDMPSFNDNIKNNLLIMEPCSFLLNSKSHIMEVGRTHILYSHPYKKALQDQGFKIIMDTSDIGLSYKYQPFSPYYLAFIYATRDINS